MADADPDTLIAELLADVGYASGRRAFPRTVAVDDALAVVARVHDEVDRGIAARTAAAAEEGVQLACRQGCSACCSEPIMVLVPEAMTVASWLASPERDEQRAAFLAAYPEWRAAVGDSLERLAELDRAGDRAEKVTAHLAHQRRHILCPFNRDGDCTVYPVRPTICRNAHAIDSAEYCGADHPSGKAATRLQFVPLDEFLVTVRRVDRALHGAVVGTRPRLAALPDLVHTLLQPEKQS